MSYPLKDLACASRNFTRCFDTSLAKFYDAPISVVSLQVCIDIIKFDEWIIRKHGNYEGKSLADVIFEHYGNEAVALINELI